MADKLLVKTERDDDGSPSPKLMRLRASPDI
jgi:hypothetical protein